MNLNTEPAKEYAGHYRIRGGSAVAWRVEGWELTPIAVWSCPCEHLRIERPTGGGCVAADGDSDCDHHDLTASDDPEYERTGRLVCVMVDDDHPHAFDPSDLLQIDDLDYCLVCGQIGCTHDGRPRRELS